MRKTIEYSIRLRNLPTQCIGSREQRDRCILKTIPIQRLLPFRGVQSASGTNAGPSRPHHVDKVPIFTNDRDRDKRRAEIGRITSTYAIQGSRIEVL